MIRYQHNTQHQENAYSTSFNELGFIPYRFISL